MVKNKHYINKIMSESSDSSYIFKNWSYNINNPNVAIYFPNDDNEIIHLINFAQNNNKILRVVGSKHSQSYTVCNCKENIILVLLKHYKSSQDIFINHDTMTVTVNAGWHLGELYNHLDLYHYYLQNQPASPAFTIGGIISLPVHGSRLGESLISDIMTGLRLINSKGMIIEKKETDEDFDVYRLNLGILGIVTHVTLKIHQMNNIKTRIERYDNIFLENGKVNVQIVEPHIKKIIQNCFPEQSNAKKIRYHHSFIDFHNNQWLSLNWKSSKKTSSEIINIPEVINLEETEKIKIASEFTKYIIPHYRSNKEILKNLGKLFQLGTIALIKLNSLLNNDLLWVDLALRVYFMSYFIPIYTEGEPMNFNNLYLALESIYETVKMSKDFNIDLPVDMRFIMSDSNELTSPVYNSKKVVFVGLEILCNSSNINLIKDKKSILPFFIPICTINKKKLKKDFINFYQKIEESWIKLGGKPHYAKMFGFSIKTTKNLLINNNKSEIFNPKLMKKIISPHNKKFLLNYSNPIFMNNFIKQLFSL